MKQIKYTKEQELIIEVIDKFCDRLSSILFDNQMSELFSIKQKLYAEYKIKNKYLTLRKYLEKYSCGAYHRFFFEIDNGRIFINDITSVLDFERTYNSRWLDKYYVIDDKKETFGDNCENYQCNHYLKLAEKEELI